MRRFPVVGILLLLPALALPLMIGCTKEPAKVTPADGEKEKKAGAAVEIKAPTDAVVKGVVKYKGEAFEAPTLAELVGPNPHKEAPLCMKGGGNHIKVQTWLVGKDKGL